METDQNKIQSWLLIPGYWRLDQFNCPVSIQPASDFCVIHLQWHAKFLIAFDCDCRCTWFWTSARHAAHLLVLWNVLCDLVAKDAFTVRADTNRIIQSVNCFRPGILWLWNWNSSSVI
jgi:hypothetical protein